MARPSFALIGCFLATLYGVPISQALIERIGDGEAPQVLDLFSQAPTEEHLRRFEKDLEERSWVAARIRPAFQLARFFLLRDLGEKVLRGVAAGWYFYQPEVRYLGERWYRELAPEEPTEDPVSVIAHFDRQLQAKGIRLVVVPVPAKPSIYPERLYWGLSPTVDLAIHTQRFQDELRREGIEVLDLRPAFLEWRRSHPDAPLYLAQDTHWTGEGARLAAEVIARRLRSLPLSASLEPSTQYERRAIRARRRGDIPAMTRLPLQDKLFEAEETTCYQVSSAGDGALYQDAPDASVLLLGDSFSRIYQSDEPRSAGLIANLAYELKTPLTTVVNDGGASTLVRQQLSRSAQKLAGKKVVLWVFTERDVRFGMHGWQTIDIP
jgi:hypothetical protein